MTRITQRRGEYFYFFLLANQRPACDKPKKSEVAGEPMGKRLLFHTSDCGSEGIGAVHIPLKVRGLCPFDILPWDSVKEWERRKGYCIFNVWNSVHDRNQRRHEASGARIRTCVHLLNWVVCSCVCVYVCVVTSRETADRSPTTESERTERGSAPSAENRALFTPKSQPIRSRNGSRRRSKGTSVLRERWQPDIPFEKGKGRTAF